MDDYRHVQSGYLLLIIYGVLILLAVPLVITTGFNPVFIVALVVFAVALGAFASLTVVVDRNRIFVEFFLGIPCKTLPLNRVIACRIVRIPWYYGWGVRYTPRGWLYRVSGFSAVEIELSGGKHFQIGTDEPAALARAVEQALLGLRAD